MAANPSPFPPSQESQRIPSAGPNPVMWELVEGMEEAVGLCKSWEPDLWAKPCCSLILLQYKPSRGTVVDWETGGNCPVGYSIGFFVSPVHASLVLGFSLFPRPPFPTLLSSHHPRGPGTAPHPSFPGGAGLSAPRAACQGLGIDFHSSAVLTLHRETRVL